MKMFLALFCFGLAGFLFFLWGIASKGEDGDCLAGGVGLIAIAAYIVTH